MKRRRIAILLAAGTLATGLGIGMAGAAHAASDPTIPDPAWNEIFAPFLNGQGNTLCVDVPNGSMSVGTRLQFFHCHGSDSHGGPQRWHFDNTGLPPREYRIFNLNSGLYIGFDSDGVHLAQEPFGQAIVWQEVLQSTDGTDPLIELVAANTNLAMASASEIDQNRNPLVVSPFTGFTDFAQILQLG
jgi:hypothetical protein